MIFTGYIGAGNLGDDLMLDVTLKYMTEKYPNKRFGVLKLYKEKLNINYKNVTIYDLSYLPGKLHYIILRLLSFTYNHLIWIGGTIFTDEEGDGLFYLMNYALKIKMKIGYIGIGINELHDSERIKKFKYLIKNSSIITIRDQKSYNYTKKICDSVNIIKTEDLVYLSLKQLKVTKNNENNLVISWRNVKNYIKSNEYEMIDELLSRIKYLYQYYEKIYIIPLDDIEDNQQNYYIYKKMKEMKLNVKFLTNLTAQEKVEYISNSKLNVSGRLHGIFISKYNNIPTISIEYSQKIKSFLESIDSYANVIKIDNLNAPKGNFNMEKEYNMIDIKLKEMEQLSVGNLLALQRLLEFNE